MSKTYSPDGIQSMVNHVGDDAIHFDVLRNNITKISTTKNNERTSITFNTSGDNITADKLARGTEDKIGIVLWVDRAAYEDWHKKG